MQLHPPVYRRLPLPLLLLLLLPLLILLLLLLLPSSLLLLLPSQLQLLLPALPTYRCRLPSRQPCIYAPPFTSQTVLHLLLLLLLLLPLLLFYCNPVDPWPATLKLVLRNPLQGLPTKLSLLAKFLQECLLPQNLYHLEKSSAAARPTKQACLAKKIKLPALSAHRNQRHSS